MKIAPYLKRRGLTVSAAADEIGINRSVLQRIVTGSRPASREAMRKIVEWSRGEVDWSDFFDSDEAA